MTRDHYTALQDEINLTRNRHRGQWQEIRGLARETVSQMNPVNLVRHGVRELTEDTEIRSDVVNSGIGMATGALLRALLFRKSANPLKKLAGIVVQTYATNYATRHADTLRKWVHVAASLFPSKKRVTHSLFSEADVYDT